MWQADEADARRLCEGYCEGWVAEGFKAVICPAFNVRIPYHPKLAALILPVWDEVKVPAGMFDCAARFHKEVGPTLVHCHGGLNRSSAFAAALLMTDGMPLEKALGSVNAMPWPELLGSLSRWAASR